MAAKITHYATRVQGGFFEDICVIKVDGRITLGEPSSGFRKYLQQQISDGYRNFIWDFSDVDYVDSSGLGELLAAATRIKMRTGKIVLIDSPGIRGPLALTKLGTVFEYASDVAAAIAKFREGEADLARKIEYEDKFSITIEKNKQGKKMVVTDNISTQPTRVEYKVRDIPPDEPSKRLGPASLIVVVLIALVTLGLTIGGLVWAAKAISSLTILVLIFTLALLIFVMISSIVLLLSGYLSEKTAAKLFGTVLGKLPGLNAFLPKHSNSK